MSHGWSYRGRGLPYGCLNERAAPAGELPLFLEPLPRAHLQFMERFHIAPQELPVPERLVREKRVRATKKYRINPLLGGGKRLCKRGAQACFLFRRQLARSMHEHVHVAHRPAGALHCRSELDDKRQPKLFGNAGEHDIHAAIILNICVRCQNLIATLSPQFSSKKSSISPRGILSCSAVSRSRIVTVSSSSVWKSTVMQYGVPISSC